MVGKKKLSNTQDLQKELSKEQLNILEKNLKDCYLGETGLVQVLGSSPRSKTNKILTANLYNIRLIIRLVRKWILKLLKDNCHSSKDGLCVGLKNLRSPIVTEGWH